MSIIRAGTSTITYLLGKLQAVISGKLDKSGGTMTGTLTAASTPPETVAVRNIYAGTADMTAGTTALSSGVIYIMYE